MNHQEKLRKKAVDELDLLKASILKGDIDIVQFDLHRDTCLDMDGNLKPTGLETTTFQYFNKPVINQTK